MMMRWRCCAASSLPDAVRAGSFDAAFARFHTAWLADQLVASLRGGRRNPRLTSDARGTADALARRRRVTMASLG